MQITGRIVYAGKLQQGETDKGKWYRIGFVIEETDAQYPERISMRARGRVAQEIAELFDDAGVLGTWTAYYSHDAHPFERDGEQRWVNDISCWKLEPWALVKN